MAKFDRDNLLEANNELQDLILVAHFTPTEKAQFLSKVKKELVSENVTLDSLESS